MLSTSTSHPRCSSARFAPLDRGGTGACQPQAERQCSTFWSRRIGSSASPLPRIINSQRRWSCSLGLSAENCISTSLRFVSRKRARRSKSSSLATRPTPSAAFLGEPGRRKRCPRTTLKRRCVCSINSRLQCERSSASLNRMNLDPFDGMVLAAILGRRDEYRAIADAAFVFCEQDKDLQPWDRDGNPSEPLASIYDERQIWVYRDFAMTGKQPPPGWPLPRESPVFSPGARTSGGRRGRAGGRGRPSAARPRRC
jgi:hypothetical protein